MEAEGPYVPKSVGMRSWKGLMFLKLRVREAGRALWKLKGLMSLNLLV